MQAEVQALPHDQLIELSPEDQEYRKKLEIIFGMLTDPRRPLTPRQAVAKIAKWKNVSERQAYNLVKQAQELFTEQSHIDKTTLRVIQTELRRKTIAEIKRDKTLTSYEKFELIDKVMTRIERINLLEEKDHLSLNQVLELLELPDTEFSTDPEILELNTEDADFEEIPDEENIRQS